MEIGFMQATTAIIKASWTMLTSLKYPGTEIPIAVILVGAFLAAYAIRILAYVLRMNINTGGLRVERNKEPKEKGM